MDRELKAKVLNFLKEEINSLWYCDISEKTIEKMLDLLGHDIEDIKKQIKEA